MHPIHTINQLISDPWYTIEELKRRHSANVPSHGHHHQGEDVMFAPNFDVRESASYYFLEGELQRSFTFPHKVDEENMRARLSSGLLKILVTKLGSEGEPRKTVEIED
jgi:hypothetical protein